MIGKGVSVSAAVPAYCLVSPGRCACRCRRCPTSRPASAGRRPAARAGETPAPRSGPGPPAPLLGLRQPSCSTFAGRRWASEYALLTPSSGPPVASPPWRARTREPSQNRPWRGTRSTPCSARSRRQRATFAWKSGGLDAAGLQATVGASTMTLGGLLKHLAGVEDTNFSWRLLGRRPPPPWDTVDWDNDPDWPWRSAAEDSPEELYALWRDAVIRSRRPGRGGSGRRRSGSAVPRARGPTAAAQPAPAADRPRSRSTRGTSGTPTSFGSRGRAGRRGSALPDPVELIRQGPVSTGSR